MCMYSYTAGKESKEATDNKFNQLWIAWLLFTKIIEAEKLWRQAGGL